MQRRRRHQQRTGAAAAAAQQKQATQRRQQQQHAVSGVLNGWVAATQAAATNYERIAAMYHKISCTVTDRTDHVETIPEHVYEIIDRINVTSSWQIAATVQDKDQCVADYTVLPFYRSTVLPFHRSTLPPYRSTVLPFYRSTVLPSPLPLYRPLYRSTILPFYRSGFLPFYLFYRSTVLSLYYSTVLPVYPFYIF